MSDYNFTREMMENGDKADNLRNIVHAIFDNDKDSCIHCNYRPDNAMGIDIDTADPQRLLDDASSYFIYEHLGFCGCGIPNASLRKVVDYLEIANQWSNDIAHSTNLWFDDKPSKNRRQSMKEKFGVEDECEDPLVQFLVYIIDHNGFTDHGSSITGCWITGKGRACLYVLKLYLQKYDDMENENMEMSTMGFMAPVKDGKVLPRGYGSIHHLPGSKMIDDKDKLLGEQETGWLTSWRRNFKDLVIVTEKVDGMNASVLRIDRQLYPIIRAGYDARTSDKNWIRAFGRFVSMNQRRFMNILNNGERVCGEWMIKTHTLSYDLPHEPYIVFDIIDENNKRLSYREFRRRVDGIFTPAGVIHMGEAIQPLTAVELLGKGYHGVVGDQPEGVVYRYENQDGYVCSGKFVSHPDVGNTEIFTNNMDNDIYNIMRSKYKQYLPNDND